MIGSINSDSRNCICCGKSFQGRSDKKFCRDYCRNAYHNQLRSDSNNYMRNIDQLLRKNRRILQELLETKQAVRITLNKMYHHGFVFNYYTHTYTNTKGKQYRFCYEYGYLLLKNEQVQITQRFNN